MGANSAKERLDVLLHQRGLAPSRERAQSLIMAGLVFDANEHRLDKPGMRIATDSEITVKGKDHPYVSRGGVKLEAGLKHFNKINLKDKIAIDVGASTGGFTDVLLRAGVKRVYAVDVGEGQLAWSLQSDSKVIVLDKTNARHLSATEIPEPIDIVVCDASFISLKKVLAASLELLRSGGFVVALIKPQFEVEKNQVGKGGIVRDEALHVQVQNDISAWLEEVNFKVLGIIPSPIKGREGNQEFIIAAHKI